MEGKDSENFTITFVCWGNIHRSPLAEHLTRHRATKLKIPNLRIQSAGNFNAHAGEPASPRMVDLAKEHGFEMKGHTAKQITDAMIEESDLLVPMDTYNEEILRRRAGKEKQKRIIRFLDFHPTSSHLEDVPDPFCAPNHSEVFSLIEGGVDGLLNSIETLKES